MNYIKEFLCSLFSLLGWLVHFIWGSKPSYLCYVLKCKFHTQLYSHEFKSFGKGAFIVEPQELKNPNRITVGANSRIGRYALVRCYDLPNEKGKSSIDIGDGVNIGDYCTISCCSHIHIGNGVLTGRMVMITDNNHGHTDSKYELDITPIKRPLVSKGDVIIDDNVWIGEKVSIMPNVHIGKGSIIAANAVVTKDIPAYSVAAGCPARVIKTIK